MSKHVQGRFRPTPIDNVPWSVVMAVLFLSAVVILGLAALALT